MDSRQAVICGRYLGEELAAWQKCGCLLVSRSEVLAIGIASGEEEGDETRADGQQSYIINDGLDSPQGAHHMLTHAVVSNLDRWATAASVRAVAVQNASTPFRKMSTKQSACERVPSAWMPR